MRQTILYVSFLATTLLVMCKQPELRENSSLRYYNFSEKGGTVMKLDRELEEISGLALLPGGNIIAHNDERGELFELDPETGTVLSSRDVGEKQLKEDFEGIAVAGMDIYLVNSSGTLYRLIDEGKPWYGYDAIKTGLTQRNDVEGLCYDPDTECLLLACKEHPGEGHSGYRAVFAYSLKDNKLLPTPRFLIKAADVAKYTPEIKFMPSGIEYHPRAGTFYVLAAHGNTLIELSRDGSVIGQVNLPKSIHRQPEGITFDGAGNLYISNEADGKHPQLIKYAYDVE